MKKIRSASMMMDVLHKKMKMDLKALIVEDKSKVCKKKISNEMLCKVFSYTYHYHKSIAIAS